MFFKFNHKTYLFQALCLIVIICNSCDNEENHRALFELMNNKSIGVDFSNDLEYTEALNTYTYRNFYNGGGVGIGDFNNDGLKDVYLTGNLVDNHLYINQGNWNFREVAESAGVACSDIWSTGVSIADINQDGWLDIYVCKSGPPGGDNRKNELFINNGDLTFTEQAASYGLDDLGLSTHAAFFDMDKDGDLDCYLLNNSLKSVGGYDLIKNQRNKRDSLGGNKLYRNDNGLFVDISEEAGIYGSRIGFGLGVTVGDLNADHWPDIYVSNDFFEKDYLYINQKDGTFKECIEERITEMSLSSMGADMADLNNDGYPEIFVTDMLPKIEERIKSKTTFDDWDKFKRQVDQGYAKQFTRNTLQLNNGDGSFSEVGRYANVYATDWSWGALIFDMDQDGAKDIFVANGLYKDLTDQDYINFIGSPDKIRGMIQKGKEVIKSLVDSIPSEPLSNAAFINEGNMKFNDQAMQLGLGKPSFSNGAVFADLDNDGDLDMVINNVNEASFFYKNNRERLYPSRHYISIRPLIRKDGPVAMNTIARLYQSNGTIQYQEVMPMRSYMSTTDNDLFFGIDRDQSVDSIVIEWPNFSHSVMASPSVDTLFTLVQPSAVLETSEGTSSIATIFKKTTEKELFPLRHVENEWSDFDREGLLIEMTSNEGPCMCSGDINNDGKEDFYFGGAKGQSGKFIISTSHSYKTFIPKSFEGNEISEDTDCVLADFDGDQLLDLYVTSGGNELPQTSSALSDRLYLNKGNNFERSDQLLPVAKYESTSVVVTADWDDDGDKDLFVGVRQIPFKYGLRGNGYLLENDGQGNFTNVSVNHDKLFQQLGMITDASFADIDQDGDDDLIVVGDWMEVTLFVNEAGIFTFSQDLFPRSLSGMWKEVLAKDLDLDGDVDFVIGNKGLNTKYRASVEHPMEMYIHDFDKNGTIEQIITAYNGDASYPLVLQPELVKQLPGLRSKYLKHSDYAGAKISDIFPREVLEISEYRKVDILSSIVLINDGAKFQLKTLPLNAQLSTIYALEADDFNNDGQIELIYGGNQERAKPQVGINSASYMGVIQFDSQGRMTYIPSKYSGIKEEGEIRSMIRLNEDILLIGKNNDQIATYVFN